jgi:hypothetical protein
MKIVPRTALFLFVAVLATGCSSFEREWRKQPPESSGIAGRWEGRWQSERTGHSGKLRAIITPQAPKQYHGWFRATYRSVLSAEYGVTLDVQQRGPRFKFLGAANLGVWGRYETTGYATATQFHATYRSKFDYGTFAMQRVAHPMSLP